MLSPPPSMMPDLSALVCLFYEDPTQFGRPIEVRSGDMPADFARLLAHEDHMTVTVEAYHRSPVDVHVLAKHVRAPQYTRKILLSRQSDDRVVQFGIMRINFDFLEPDVRRQIEDEQTPLGRVLIEHNVLRRVRLARLWEIHPGPDLRQLLAMNHAQVAYGRTALIECNGVPAVELLEIVPPLEPPQ
jgi:chorismate-pyruvate lyase